MSARAATSKGPGAAGLLLLGSTGLVGSGLLSRLLTASDSTFEPIWLPQRRQTVPNDRRCRSLPIVPPPIDPDHRDASLPTEFFDAPLNTFVSCLGTTRRQAGSAEAFVAVDRDLVLAWARVAKQRGARHALLVSSIGADARSNNLYLRSKGELEDALRALGFDRLDLLRPSLLIGRRQGSARPAEAVGQTLAPLLNRLLWGGLRYYRSIKAEQVAAALQVLMKETAPGDYVHAFDELIEAANSASS